MATYKEETYREVTIRHDGEKIVRDYPVVLKDGVLLNKGSPNTKTIAYDEDVPQDVSDHIEAKKGKQPKK